MGTIAVGEINGKIQFFQKYVRIRWVERFHDPLTAEVLNQK